MEGRKISAREALNACREPHLRRLTALVDLSEIRDRLDTAMTTVRLLAVGQSMSVTSRPVFLISGWACRARILADGRRQIFSHLLPGDLAQGHEGSHGIGRSLITALVPTVVFAAPEHFGAIALQRAYEALANDEGRYLHGQVLRLGRLTAIERLVHLFLEFAERLQVIGVGNGEDFPLPISQEIVADTLGLTTVHINRTLQALRRDAAVKWEAGYVSLSDPVSLASKVYFEQKPRASALIDRRKSNTEAPLLYGLVC